MAASHKPRLVRKESIWSRIYDWPLNWWMGVSEEYSTFNWERLQEQLSWPLAIFLNSSFFIVKMWFWFFEEPAIDIFDNLKPKPYTWGTLGRTTANKLNIFLRAVEYGLIAISLINSIYLFSRTKKYNLLQRDLEEPPNSPNAKIVDFENHLRPMWASSFPGYFLYPLYRRMQIRRRSKEARYHNIKQVWEMNIWNPPAFSLNLFSWFSPMQVLALHFLDADNWQWLIWLAGSTGLVLWYMTYNFRNLIKDWQIIFGEVLHEYNESLVNPRLFVKKYEVGTTVETTDEEDDDDETDTESVRASGSALLRTPVRSDSNYSSRRNKISIGAHNSSSQTPNETPPKGSLADRSSPYKTNDNPFQAMGRKRK